MLRRINRNGLKRCCYGKKTTSVLSGNRLRQQNTALALWFPVLTASRRGVDDERRREADRTGQKVRTKLTGGIKLPEAASWGAAILAALGGSHSCATVATHISMRGFVNRDFSPRAKNLFLDALSPRFYPHSIQA